jgi:hypothetical protein
VSLPSFCGDSIRFGTFFENRNDSRLSLAYPFGNELCCEDRFARSRRPGDEDAIAFAHASTQHYVQLGNTEGKPPTSGRVSLACGQPKRARKSLHSVVGYAKRVQTRDRILASQFDYLEFPHDGVSLCRLAQPEQTICDSEYWIVT